eukprot:12402617-Karenia_brevis.AAC.1
MDGMVVGMDCSINMLGEASSSSSSTSPKGNGEGRVEGEASHFFSFFYVWFDPSCREVHPMNVQTWSCELGRE